MPAALHRPEIAPKSIWPDGLSTRVNVKPDSRVNDNTNKISETASREMLDPKAKIAENAKGRVLAAPTSNNVTCCQFIRRRMSRP